MPYNFCIESDQRLSLLFRDSGVSDFCGAADFICKLPYRRNENKYDVTSVFTDQCGTCSTKHAVLQLLAEENGQAEVKLMLGIFKMNAMHMPKIGKTLERYGLTYIPEAHNYLRIAGAIADYTWVHTIDFSKDLLTEQEIRADQITAYKVKFHRDFLQDWLERNSHIPYSLEVLWAIREQCIRDLAGA